MSTKHKFNIRSKMKLEIYRKREVNYSKNSLGFGRIKNSLSSISLIL